MSVRVISWVWDNSRAEGTDRLVLLAIADCASDDGGNAWPSVKTLADKAKVSTRTVQRSIKALVLLGELSVDQNAGRGGANVYTLRMGRQSDTGDKVTPVSDSHPRQNDRVTPVTPRGDKRVTRTVKNHPSTPQPPASGGRAHCDKHTKFRNGCDRCREADAAARAKPPWCGSCDENTRQQLDPETHMPARRCPDCHPLTQAKAAS